MRQLYASVVEKFGVAPMILLIILSSDATNITSWSGRQAHPWYIACGNDPAVVRNSVEGKQVVGYLEKLPGTLLFFRILLTYFLL